MNWFELIYQKRWGGKWNGFLCCHTWKTLFKKKVHEFVIEKNECIDCGRREILLGIKWY